MTNKEQAKIEMQSRLEVLDGLVAIVTQASDLTSNKKSEANAVTETLSGQINASKAVAEASTNKAEILTAYDEIKQYTQELEAHKASSENEIKAEERAILGQISDAYVALFAVADYFSVLDETYIPQMTTISADTDTSELWTIITKWDNIASYLKRKLLQHKLIKDGDTMITFPSNNRVHLNRIINRPQALELADDLRRFVSNCWYYNQSNPNRIVR